MPPRPPSDRAIAKDDNAASRDKENTVAAATGGHARSDPQSIRLYYCVFIPVYPSRAFSMNSVRGPLIIISVLFVSDGAQMVFYLYCDFDSKGN